MKRYLLIIIISLFTSCSKSSKTEQKNPILISHDFAEFPGGTKALDHYIKDNWQWREPKDTVESNVFMHFVVRENGEIADIGISRTNGCKSCEEEAFRLIKGMPKWNPAIKNGKAIDQRVTIPIMFQSSSIK